MRSAIILLFFIIILQCSAEGCVTEHDHSYPQKKKYSWDFDLDYQDEEYDYNKNDEQVEPNRPQDNLVVTICDYDNNGDLYCYDLP